MTTVITQSAGRRERKKAEARQRIITSAIRLFGKRGIDAVTVDEIAAAADVGKGTIYNYFHTKEDIVVAFMADLEDDVQRRAATLDVTGRPLAEVLAEFIRISARMKRRYHPFVRVFLGQMFLRTETFLPHLIRINQLTMPVVEGLFRRLQDNGVVRRDVNVADVSMAFVNMHFGLTALWAIEGPPFRASEHALIQAMTLMSEGLEARKR